MSIKLNSQANRLLNHLKTGAKIHRLTALVDLGIFELSARIIDITNAGYLISKTRISITNRFGEKASVVEYSLALDK
jgi:hypothetical protein